MGDRPAHSLERDIAAWLETVAAGAEATLRDQPDATIVPPVAAATTGGKRALALLEQLASGEASSTARLQTGETIGEGGMGIVRLAEQVALGRTVAVKTLKPDRRTEANALDLLREAWVTGAVEHPNVVPVHTIGLDAEGSPLIVLKRIEGRDWSELIDDADAVRESFGADDLLAWNLGILSQVLNALRLAHSKGIIHRDLKPENVMIGGFGEVYLVDWGIAVSLRDDGSGRLPLASSATEMAGTPCYMAPEMLGSERGVPLSEATDVYLAGAVLYEIMSGTPPHMGDSAIAIITSVATSRPEMPADAPPELARICLRAMSPDPADRPDAEELSRDLARYLEHRGSNALARRAMAGLEELLAAVAEPSDDAGGKRERIYRLFGACRFGFHEALTTWRDNPDARDGLRRAIATIARFELDEGDPRAAVTLLNELEAPPAELWTRARDAAAERTRRDAELAELDRNLDWTIGTRTRAFLAGVMGLIFTAVPLASQLVGGRLVIATYTRGLIVTIGSIALLTTLGVWARESMTKTRVNRIVFASLMFLFLAQLVMITGLYMAGIPPDVALFSMMFLWFTVAGMFVVCVDRRLWPCALGYLAAFLAAAHWPDEQLWIMAAGNFVFCLNAVSVWRPRQGWLRDREPAVPARGLPPGQ